MREIAARPAIVEAAIIQPAIAETEPDNIVVPTPVKSDVLDYVWVLWIGVALVLFTHKVASYRGFVRFIKLGAEEITDAHVLELYSEEFELSKIKRRLPLCLNNQAVSPMLVGVISPMLILPAMDVSSGELRNILRHELTHHRRLDYLYKWLLQITLCLHWFNPLIYLVVKQINKNCELSCDEGVISRLDSDDRIIYGDALMASLTSQGNYGNFVVSMTMSENGGIIKERLDMIMNYKKKTRPVVLLTLLLTLAMLCGFTFAGAYMDEQNKVAATEGFDSSGFNTTSINDKTWYLVETEDQLRAIAYYQDTLSRSYLQNADFYIKNVWTSIGTDIYPFTGEYNGNGFSMGPLYLRLPGLPPQIKSPKRVFRKTSCT